MTANTEELGLLGRRLRVLKSELASVTKITEENPSSLPDDKREYYQTFLTKWFADMNTLNESTRSCQSEDKEKIMNEFTLLIQSYHVTLEKLNEPAIPVDVIEQAGGPAPVDPTPELKMKHIFVNLQYRKESQDVVVFETPSARLKGNLKVIMKAAPLDPRLRFRFNLEKVGKRDFHGRKTEMDELHSTFQRVRSHSSENACKTMIVHGMPGVGKTSLVAAFLSLHQKEFANFHIFWISADTKQSIRDEMIQACENSFPGLPLKDAEGNPRTDEDLMSVIYNQITRNPVLIIFDNAASAISSYGIEETIADFFCKTVQPGHHTPVYIVTTRTRAPELWKGCNANMLQLGPFSQEDCWSHMKSALPVLANYEEECRLLWKHFNGLPGAVEHALDIMKRQASLCHDPLHYNPEKLVRKTLAFENISCEYAKGKKIDLYEKLQLWDNSMELLRNVPNIGEYAIHVLDVISLLSANGIPENFLLEILKRYALRDDAQFENEDVELLMATSINLLNTFSLIDKSVDEQIQLIHVNVLVQAHRRQSYLQPVPRLESHVIAVAESIIAAPSLTSDLQKSEHSYNLDNLQSVSNMILKLEDNAELRINFARYIKDCLPQTALSLLPTHDDTFTTLDIKSSCHANLGNYDQALRFSQKAYECACRSLGENHHDTLEIKSSMAKICWNFGNYSDALELSKQVSDASHHPREEEQCGKNSCDLYTQFCLELNTLASMGTYIASTIVGRNTS